jgi:hypothetical protein
VRALVPDSSAYVLTSALLASVTHTCSSKPQCRALPSNLPFPAQTYGFPKSSNGFRRRALRTRLAIQNAENSWRVPVLETLAQVPLQAPVGRGLSVDKVLASPPTSDQIPRAGCRRRATRG